MLHNIRKRLLCVALMAGMVLTSLSPAAVTTHSKQIYVRETRVIETTVTSDCPVTKSETV